MIFHEPVMVREVIDSLDCKRNGIYVDGTVGGGCHAYGILEKTAPEGVLIGIDRDEEALEAAEIRLKGFGARKVLVKGNFADLSHILEGLNIGSVDGILLDLGVSSHQVDQGERGFSFSYDAPLDMRMDREQALTALHVVNEYAEQDVERIIRFFGEEKMAKQITRAIVKKRRVAPIRTTGELAAICTDVLPYGKGRQRVHPATRTFQAIRIAVNGELENLSRAIESGTGALRRGGRFSIISFHSLEDRIVKREFRRREGGCICPARLPVCVCNRKAQLKVLTSRPVRPQKEETEANLRARSARLRTAERI